MMGSDLSWLFQLPIGSMYAIYGNIYHHYTPNVSIYTIHGSYGLCLIYVHLCVIYVYEINCQGKNVHVSPFMKQMCNSAEEDHGSTCHTAAELKSSTDSCYQQVH
jgi:hypothetical protein